jgi:hypothetical protein
MSTNMDATGEEYVRVEFPDKGHIAVHVEVEHLPPISMALNPAQLEEKPPLAASAHGELEGIPFTGVVSMVRHYAETAAKLHAAGQGKDVGQREEAEQRACALALYTALHHPQDGEKNRAAMERQMRRYDRALVIWMLRGNRLLTEVLDEAESMPIS